jgi:NAD(P)-dependent dehydrogenase (short-subunit alcohol dehydrogenase family)
MQSAIVTGASSGIGRASAEAFAASGYGVLAVGRDVAALDELSSGVARNGGHCVPLAADLTEDGAIEGIVPAALAAFGRLDVLVNAAGIIGSGTIETTQVEDADYMMGVNVRAPLMLMQAAVPALVETRGTIVNVSSVAGLRAFPGVLAYCISKAALDQLTRCAALELAPKGIRVNAVNPGVVISALHRRSGMNEDSYAAFLEHSRSTHPLGRVGTPAEIAELILFLASNRAGWITGETISIDGGRHLTCSR